MPASRFARPLLLGLCLSSVAAGVFAQAQLTKEKYQPEVGQPGKDVVWVPTAQVLVDKMLDIAKLTPQDYLIDLGSGDGRTVIAAAKRGARAVGLEFNADMVELSRENAARAGVHGKATIVQGDLFEADLSPATVITMFLLPEINLKLRPKLLDLEPGTRIVSNSFTMEEWSPDETATVTDGCENWCTALLWVVPAKVAGTWRLSDGELTLKQAFQMISGTLDAGGKSTPISDGRLRGDEIRFNAGGVQYAGRVRGDTIEGTITTRGAAATWKANRAGR
jgi:SAM-dependent methyltransferase